MPFKPVGTVTGLPREDMLYAAQPLPAYITVPNGALTAWNNALAGSAKTPAIATIFGASVPQGGSSTTDVMTKCYWALWRAAKVTQYGIYGDFFTPYHSAAWQTVTASQWPFVMDAVPAQWINAGLSRVPGYTVLNNGGNPLMHYVHPSTQLGYNARSFEIVYFDNAAGSFNWSASWVAGGVNQAVTLNGDAKIHKVSITGGPNTAGNVVNFQTQDAANHMAIIGVNSYPGSAGAGTSGVGFVWNAWGGGATMHDVLVEASTSPREKFAMLAGPTSAFPTTAYPTGAYPMTGFTFGFPFNADLAIIDGYDDAAYQPLYGVGVAAGNNPTLTAFGLPPDAYTVGLWFMCQAMRTKPTGCSFVFHVPSYPNGITSDVTMPAAANPQNYSAYSEIHWNLAGRVNAALINTYERWGARGATMGFQPANNVHPTDAGHADIYQNGLVPAGL